MPPADRSPVNDGPPGFELLDAGELRRLERFAGRVVDRPAPTALDWRRDSGAWSGADLRFDAGGGWRGPLVAKDGRVEPWTLVLDGLTLELRPTASGGVGLYPEHAANLAWLERQLAGCEAPSLLNLFAHTGLATLAAARAGASVAHVDAARSAVAWARRNAELSNLADRPIRWLVDDAAGFVAREARRGRRYDGIVVDPPSFGHAGRRRWRLEDELPALLDGCAAVLTDDGFVLLTAHTTGLEGPLLEEALLDAIPARLRRVETAPLVLEAASGARLELGWSVRMSRG